MGNKTEETRNGKQDKKRHFSTTKKLEKQGINRKNRGGNTKKQGEKQEKKLKITRNTETRQDKILARQDFSKTRFWQDKISARQDIDKISGNAENRNENNNEVS